MSAVVTALNTALILLLIIAAGIIVRRVIVTRKIPLHICLFPILPVSLLLMLYSLSFDEWSVSWVLGLLLGLAANILLLIHAISQEKKIAAQEELREIQHRLELEKSHYEAALHRQEELEKIRIDFNEKLEAIAGAVRSGGDAGARESITALAERIRRTKENPYCAVPVINAVLTQKEQDCAAAGITLSVDLKLPDTLAASPMHLCSIFSNILDNAIAACRKIGDNPMIRLSSIVDGDYLIIKAVNPSNEPRRKPAPGRGYGLRILFELVRQYGGDFTSGYRDGFFTTVISLPITEQGGLI